MARFDKKTIVVCGGCGFIGSNFIRYILANHTRVKIINFDKLTYSGNKDNTKEFFSGGRYKFIKGDVADKNLVDDIFKKNKPEYVINFAAETHVDRSIHVGALEFLRTNIEGVFNLLEVVKGSQNVKKYVQVSTDEVYGSLALSSLRKFREITPFSPNVPYAATKAGGDLLCGAYYSTWKIPVVVTHCSNNYGAYQYPEKLIPFFISRMLENKKLPLYGDGKNVRDWIYVLDHCRALEMCLLEGRAGEVYNIGADNELSNLEIANRVLSYFNRDASWIEFVADRPGHDRRYSIDNSKIRKELGWRPRYKFSEAFRETVTWYLQHEKWIDKIRKKTGVFNPHIDLWKAHAIK